MSYWFVFFFNGKVNRLIWGECIPFTDVYTRIVESVFYIALFFIDNFFERKPAIDANFINDGEPAIF
ncbi:hypothetical protein DW035_13715 [Phocaeicola plebeius]|uniref:Uncharacterized protein n=1 Tax=Phocaeicola plebeius TaxID=310297 RepID=A0A415IWZ0_9BACT|nr:hypothetical protein DW041_13425 [Phocaeicola plebeius]RHL12147.1 hypothetical protein DW035_13715 [Phocaeicola plebeius]